jgi:hypothetical protein
VKSHEGDEVIDLISGPEQGPALTMLPKKWRGGEPQFAPLGAFRPAFLREEEGGKYLDGSQGDRGHHGDEHGLAGHLPGECCGVFDPSLGVA